MYTILLSLSLATAGQNGRVPPPDPVLPEPIFPAHPVIPPSSTLVPIYPSERPQYIPTLAEFAASFVPLPGVHEVTVIHPLCKKPVTVTFRLPPGCPKVRLGKRFIEFDYGKCEVEVIFRICGKVDVRYD